MSPSGSLAHHILMRLFKAMTGAVSGEEVASGLCLHLAVGDTLCLQQRRGVLCSLRLLWRLERARKTWQVQPGALSAHTGLSQSPEELEHGQQCERIFLMGAYLSGRLLFQEAGAWDDIHWRRGRGQKRREGKARLCQRPHGSQVSTLNVLPPTSHPNSEVLQVPQLPSRTFPPTPTPPSGLLLLVHSFIRHSTYT